MSYVHHSFRNLQCCLFQYVQRSTINMTDSTVSPSSAVPLSPKSPKKKPATARATNTKSDSAKHPSTSIMVTTAIKKLQDKKGSTLQAIKKYISVNYQVNSTKSAYLIGKFLKAAVLNGVLVQTKGSGASGNFKMAEVKKKKLAKVAKKPSTKKLKVKKSITAKAPDATKKRKSTSKKPKSSEPATKKVKKAIAVAKPKIAKSPVKPKVAKSPAKPKVAKSPAKPKAAKSPAKPKVAKSPAKAKKAPATKTKPPKAKTPVKKTAVPKKK